MKCSDHDDGPMLGRDRIKAIGEACDVPDCGRYVASVDEHVSVGGIVCRVTETRIETSNRRTRA